MFLVNDFFVFNSMLDNSLIPDLYFILLLFFLIPFSFFVTSQLIQLISLENHYRQVFKQKSKYYLSEYFIFVVKILVEKRLWFVSIHFLESIASSDLKDSHRYFNIMGFIYYKMGEYNLAKEYYLKAISVKNDYILGLQNLAKVYEVEKAYDLALITYNSILSYDPENLLAQANVSELNSRDSRI